MNSSKFGEILRVFQESLEKMKHLGKFRSWAQGVGVINFASAVIIL